MIIKRFRLKKLFFNKQTRITITSRPVKKNKTKNSHSFSNLKEKEIKKLIGGINILILDHSLVKFFVREM